MYVYCDVMIDGCSKPIYSCFATSGALFALHVLNTLSLNTSYLQAIQDGHPVLEQQLNIDWKILVAKETFRRFVSSDDVSVKTGAVKLDRVRSICDRAFS